MRALPILALVGACATKGVESDPPLDGAFEAFTAPTDHGEVVFGATQTATLTPDTEVHTWTFTVSGAVTVRAFTDLVPKHSGVDTVMYLFKKSPAGWGPFIARDDDDGRLEWSSIGGTLGAGEYRVLVKGYSAAEHGGFELEVDCTGAGCTPAVPCMFAPTSTAIRATDQLGVTSAVVTAAADLSELDRQRVILALHESTHTEVATVDDALVVVDQHQLQRIELYDHVGARGFTAIEYAAGGNTYGAIFAGDTTERVAAIHDATVVSCTAVAQTCLFGESFAALIADLEFALDSQRTVTKANQLTGVAADQALAAIRVGLPAVTDLADGLASIAAGGLDVRVLEDSASRRLIDVYDYRLAGAIYGELFVGDATAATVDAGAIFGCTLVP